MDPAKEPLREDQIDTPIVRREAEKELFTWIAPSRPFKVRTREFYVTLFAIVGIVGFILFIAEGAMPVVLLISIVFLFYVLSNVKPEDIEYKITTKGIKIGGRLTNWELLGRYWFSKYGEYDLLKIETGVLPGRMELVVKNSDLDTLRKHLSEYLIEEEIPASGLEKFTSWLSSKLPGN